MCSVYIYIFFLPNSVDFYFEEWWFYFEEPWGEVASGRGEEVWNSSGFEESLLGAVAMATAYVSFRIHRTL